MQNRVTVEDFHMSPNMKKKSIIKELKILKKKYIGIKLIIFLEVV
jgi:hypothetical protein